MAEWVQREHGKGAIDRAGALLIPWWTGESVPDDYDDLDDQFGIVENWRTSHGLPLNVFQAALRSRAKRVEEDVIVAQRMKRLSWVMNKLVRQPHMKLPQTQDLGPRSALRC